MSMMCYIRLPFPLGIIVIANLISQTVGYTTGKLLSHCPVCGLSAFSITENKTNKQESQYYRENTPKKFVHLLHFLFFSKLI